MRKTEDLIALLSILPHAADTQPFGVRLIQFRERFEPNRDGLLGVLQHQGDAEFRSVDSDGHDVRSIETQ